METLPHRVLIEELTDCLEVSINLIAEFEKVLSDIDEIFKDDGGYLIAGQTVVHSARKYLRDN